MGHALFVPCFCTFFCIFFDDTHRARWLTVLCRAKRSAMVAPCGHVLGRSVAQTECLLTLAPYASCENLILPPARWLILAADLRTGSAALERFERTAGSGRGSDPTLFQRRSDRGDSPAFRIVGLLLLRSHWAGARCDQFDAWIVTRLLAAFGPTDGI